MVSNTEVFPTVQRSSFETEGWEEQEPVSLCFVTPALVLECG